MPGWDGAGNFSLNFDWTDDRDAGTKILASRHDTQDETMRAGIQACLAKNGENSATANLPMGGFKHTGAAAAVAAGEYVRFEEFTRGKFKKGSDIASAAALAPGTDGNYFDVTGTTAITSINTVAVGAELKLHFDGILTLTHHATDLILPGAANITTAAGDEATFVEYATGDWRCTSYQKAAIAPFPGLVLLDTKTASASASLDFTTGIGTTYDAYLFVFDRVLAANDGVRLYLRVSDDGGATWEADSTDYEYANMSLNSNAAGWTNGDVSQGAAQMILSAGVGNAGATEALCGEVFMFSPGRADPHMFHWRLTHMDNTGTPICRMDIGNGTENAGAAALNGVQFLMSAGNITSGTIRLYGVRQ